MSLRGYLAAMPLLLVMVATAATTPEGDRPCTPVSTMWSDVRPDHAILAVATDDWWHPRYVDLPFYDARPDTVYLDKGERPVWIERLPPDSMTHPAQRFRVAAPASGHGLDVGADFWVIPVDGCLDSWPIREDRWVESGDTVMFV